MKEKIKFVQIEFFTLRSMFIEISRNTGGLQARQHYFIIVLGRDILGDSR